MPIQKFFKMETAFFWLCFVESQLTLSNKYVLETESRKIAAFEVFKKISDLREVIQKRKSNKYIPDKALKHFLLLSVEVQEETKEFMANFYEELLDYLENWSHSLDGAEIFSWLSLNFLPDWENDVKPSVKYIQARHGLETLNTDEVFDELDRLQQYMNGNLLRWEAEKVESDSRWNEAINNLKSQKRPIDQISLMVQYAFAIPGTSTEVERLFSIINDVWGSDKGNLSLQMLESIVNVKLNRDQSCIEFYESIKSNKKLLQKVHRQEKYDKMKTTQPTQ
jgi:hypothetical protein